MTDDRTRLAKLFRRVMTSGSYLPEIDGLRFIAIAAVVAVHVWGYWIRLESRPYPFYGVMDAALSSLLALGGYGVHLFFIISGFVLATPFCRHVHTEGPKVDLRRYFWRRLTRLEPPYVVSMLMFFAAAPFAEKGSWSALFPHLLASLGYVHELVYQEGSPINNNAWSLEIEIQFYLLMPALAMMLWLPAAARQSILSLLIFLLSANGLWLPPAAPRTILQYGQFFLMGVLLCDIWMTRWRDKPRTPTADIPGLVAWPAFIAVNTSVGGIVAGIANPWIMAALFYSALRGTLHSKVLSYGMIPLIGGMCYSIYLLHARVIAITLHLGGRLIPHTGTFWGDYTLAFLACCLPVLLVSGCFFLLIEKPCMDPLWPQKTRDWIARASRRRGGMATEASP